MVLIHRYLQSKDKRKKDSYHFNMDTYVDNYIAAYKFANQKGLFWGSFLAVNFDGESEYHCRSCTPLSSPHLTPDGYISACDMVLLGSKPYHMSVFVIGKWDFNKKLFEIDMEKVHNLENRKSSNIEHCKNCVVKLHCGGYCLGEIVNESGYLNGQNTLKCQAIRKLYKELGPCKPYKYLHP